MIAELRAELRKLLSVRATYVIVIIAASIAAAVCFYAQGYAANPANLQNPNYLAAQATGALSAVTIIGSLAGVLLLANEYRYNTILYAFTSSASRARVLLAKFVVVSGYMLVFGALICLLSIASTWLGVQVKGNELGAQSIVYSNLIWKAAYYAWGFGILALGLTAIIRNQVGAIMALFIIPLVAETFMALALKDNSSYLPFSALNTILFAAPDADTTVKHLTVSLLTILGLWVVAFVSFVKRDAN